MKALQQYSPLLVFTLLLSACASDVGLPGLNIDDDRLNINGVGVFQVSPVEDSLDVDPLTQVVVEFTGAISESSVWEVRIPGMNAQPYRFRVEDDAGNPMAGDVTISSDRKQLAFTRMINGTPVRWDFGTTYTIYVQNLRDAEEEPIHNFFSNFSVAETGSSTGSGLEVVRAYPSSYDILASTAVDIEFNMPIGTHQQCNRSLWQSVIQTFVVETRNASGSLGVPTIAPDICLLCSPSTGCNKLRILPPGGWPTPHSFANWLFIRVVPQPNFTSVSGQRMEEDSLELFDWFIIRTNYN
jgi:hypothetical protein